MSLSPGQQRGSNLGVSVICLASVGILLLAPQFFTEATFGVDWINHLWFGLQQGQSIASTSHPSYFIHNNELGIFYPIFAFYGGTLFALTGYLSELSPGISVISIYALLYALGFVMSYGGFLWFSHQAGLTGWKAHIPGLIFATSAFYLTNLYGRSDFPEFMATSAIPLVLASGLRILKTDRLGPVTALLFILSTVLLTGSHAITFAWGTLFLLAVGAVLLVAFSDRTRKRLPILVGLALLAVSINLWTILPTVAYHDLLGIRDIGYERSTVVFVSCPKTT